MFNAFVPGPPNAVARGGRLYDHVGEASDLFVRLFGGFSLDLRELAARLMPTAEPKDAILAPWKDPALRKRSELHKLGRW